MIWKESRPSVSTGYFWRGKWDCLLQHPSFFSSYSACSPKSSVGISASIHPFRSHIWFSWPSTHIIYILTYPSSGYPLKTILGTMLEIRYVAGTKQIMPQSCGAYKLVVGERYNKEHLDQCYKIAYDIKWQGYNKKGDETLTKIGFSHWDYQRKRLWEANIKAETLAMRKKVRGKHFRWSAKDSSENKS